LLISPQGRTNHTSSKGAFIGGNLSEDERLQGLAQYVVEASEAGCMLQQVEGP
jgi:hypothetical protein